VLETSLLASSDWTGVPAGWRLLALGVLILAGFAAVFIARMVGERPERPTDLPDHHWRVARAASVPERRHAATQSSLPRAGADDDLGAPFRSGTDPGAWAAVKPAAGWVTMSAARTSAPTVEPEAESTPAEPAVVAGEPPATAPALRRKRITGQRERGAHASREMAKPLV
jgi:hypothetical protein